MKNSMIIDTKQCMIMIHILAKANLNAKYLKYLSSYLTHIRQDVRKMLKQIKDIKQKQCDNPKNMDLYFCRTTWFLPDDFGKMRLTKDTINYGFQYKWFTSFCVCCGNYGVSLSILFNSDCGNGEYICNCL